MKKKNIILVAFFALLFFGVNANAQKFGVMASYTSTSSTVTDAFKAKSVSNYHAGVVLRLPSLLGLSIQPALLYNVKATEIDGKLGDGKVDLTDLKAQVGYLEIPVQIQYGLNFILARPYIFAEPFVGYGIHSKVKGFNPKGEKESTTSWDLGNIKRWEYGLGLGAGVEVWRFQLSAKYFWNFGSLCKDGKKDKIPDNIKDAVGTAFRGGKNFNGVNVSLAYFF